MAKQHWSPATVYCRRGEPFGAGVSRLSGTVRVTGRWVRLRPEGGREEMWISAAVVQRIVWLDARPPS